jgi:large subunit ribosomal protein L23
MSLYHKQIIKPVINEKSLQKVVEENKYTFIVNMDANKPLVKKAVENLFNVNVEKVNLSVKKGKSKRFKNIQGKQNDIKKAIVQLKTGQTIEAFNNLK